MRAQEAVKAALDARAREPFTTREMAFTAIDAGGEWAHGITYILKRKAAREIVAKRNDRSSVWLEVRT